MQKNMRKKIACLLMAAIMAVGTMGMLPARAVQAEAAPPPAPQLLPAESLPPESLTDVDLPHYRAFTLEDEAPPIMPLQLPNLDVPYFPTQIMEIYTIDDTVLHYMRLYDFQRTNRSDMQALGFILPAGASFRVRQVVPEFRGDVWWQNFNNSRSGTNNNLVLDLFSHMGASRRRNIHIPNDGTWVVITGATGDNARDTVPFIRTPFAMPGSPNPILEFEILPDAPVLPIYRYTDSRDWTPGVNDDFTTYAAWDAWDTPEARIAHEEFIASWTDQSYGVILGNSVQLFVSANDRRMDITVNGPHMAETGEAFWRGEWDLIANLRHFVNLDQVLGYYDHMHGMFDYWAGLNPAQPRWRDFQIWDAAEFNNDDPRHNAPPNTVLAAPHVGGVGGGYWTGTNMGQSSIDGSIERFYIRRSWGSLHELGHGYQGTHFRGNLGEVWNNLYSHFYQVTYILPTHPLTPFPWHDPAFEGTDGWIGGGLEASRAQVRSDQANFTNTVGDGNHYGVNSSIFFDGNCSQHNLGGTPENLGAFRGRHNAERRLHNVRVNLGVPYHTANETNMAYFYIILFEAAGGMDEGFRAFNRLYREWFAENKQGIRTWTNYNVHALLFSLVSGQNFVPYFEAWGVDISETVREQVAHLPGMLILYDMVDCADTRASLVETHGLVSEFSLIRSDLLATANIPTTLEYTIEIDDIAQILGKTVYVKVGNEVVATEEITGNTLRFEGLPIGAYTVFFPYSDYQGYFVPQDNVIVRSGDNVRTVTYGSITPCMMDVHAIHLLGLEDRHFGTVTVDAANGVARIIGFPMVPSSPHGAAPHATITILNGAGDVVHTREFIANAAAAVNGAIDDTVAIQPGYTVRVVHVNNVSPSRVLTHNHFFGNRTNLDQRATTNNFEVTQTGMVRSGTPAQSPDAAAAALLAQVTDFAARVSTDISAENRENFRTHIDERNKLFAAIMALDETHRMATAAPVMDVLYTPWQEMLALFTFDTLTALGVTAYPSGSALALAPAFSPTVNQYAVTVASDVDRINITAAAEGAPVSGDLGVQNLAFGTNTFVVSVGAAVQNNYTIVVTRPSEETGFVSNRTAAVPTITRQPLNQAAQVNTGVSLNVNYLLHGEGTTSVTWFEAPDGITYSGVAVGTGNALSITPRNAGTRYFYAEIRNYNPNLTGADPVHEVHVRTRIVAVETTAAPTARVADIVSRFDSHVAGSAIYAITNEDSFPVELSVSPGATWRLFSDPAMENEIANRTLTFAGNGNQLAYVLVENGDLSAVYVLSVTRQNIVLPDGPQGWSVEAMAWSNTAQNYSFEPVNSNVVVVDFDLTGQNQAGTDFIIAFDGANTAGPLPNIANNNYLFGHVRLGRTVGGWRVDGFEADRSVTAAAPHGTGAQAFTAPALSVTTPNGQQFLVENGPTPVRVVMDLGTQRNQIYVGGQPVSQSNFTNFQPNTDPFITGGATQNWMRFRSHHRSSGTTFNPRTTTDVSRVFIAGGNMPAHPGTLSIDNFRVTESSARYEALEIPVILLQPDGSPWLENGNIVSFPLPLVLNSQATVTELDLPADTGEFTIFDFETIHIPRVTRATVITATATQGGTVQATPQGEINFVNEMLTNLVANALYRISVGDVPVILQANANGEIAIAESWIGESLAIVHRGDGANGFIDSAPQTIAVPARPQPPEALTSLPGTGVVSGLTTAMEYRSGNDDPWAPVTNPDAQVAFGTMQVRIAATETAFASNYVSVAVAPAAPASATVGSVTSYSAIIELGTPAADVAHVVRFTHNDTERTITTAPGATYVRILPLSLGTAYTVTVASLVDGAESAPATLAVTTNGHPEHRPINFDWAEAGEVVDNSYAASPGDRIQPDGTLAGRPTLGASNNWISGETPNLAGNFMPGVTINPNQQFHRVVETGDGGNALQLVSASTENRHIVQYHFPAITDGIFEFTYRTRTLQGQFNAIELLGTIDGVGDNIPVITVVQFTEAGVNHYSYELSNLALPHTGTQGEARPSDGIMRNVAELGEWVDVRMIVNIDTQEVTVLINDEVLVDRTAFRYRTATGSVNAAPRFTADQYTAITGFQVRPQNGGVARFEVTDIIVTPQVLAGDILFDNVLENGNETITATLDGVFIGDLAITWSMNGNEVGTGPVLTVTPAMAGETLEVSVESNHETGTLSGTTQAGSVTITTTHTPGGTVSGGGLVPIGNDATLTATPYATYNFIGWFENGELVSASNPWTFTANNNRSVEARFGGTVSISVTAGEGGTVETCDVFQAGDGVFDGGTVLTFTATANDGFEFMGWYVGEASIGTGLVLELVAAYDMDIVAVFNAMLTLDISSSGGSGAVIAGAGTPVVDVPFEGEFLEGSIVAVRAFPSPGYVFVGWVEDGVMVAGPNANNNQFFFAIAESRSLTAVFRHEDDPVPVISIDLGDATRSVTSGSAITVTAIPTPADAHIEDVDWGSSVPFIADVVVNEDNELTVSVLGLNPGVATITITINGQVSASITVTVEEAPLPPELPTPTGLAVEDNELSWTPVAEAVAYRIYVGGEYFATAQNSPFTLTGLLPGTHMVTVRAVGDGIAYRDSQPSAPVPFEVPEPDPVPLVAPTGLAVSPQGVVSWVPVENAVSYRVYVDGDYVGSPTTSPFILPALPVGTHNITVRAVGDGVLFSDSPLSASVPFEVSAPAAVPLAAPTGLDVSPSGIVSWVPVENAVSYRVYVDGDYVGTATTSPFMLPTLPAGTHNITVRAVGDGVRFSNSAPSASVPFEVSAPAAMPLAAPADLDVSPSGIVSWAPVENAVSYRIYAGGEYVGTATTSPFMLPTLPAGTHSITVRAVGDGVLFSNSAPSAAFTFVVQPPVIVLPPVQPPVVQPPPVAPPSTPAAPPTLPLLPLVPRQPSWASAPPSDPSDYVYVEYDEEEDVEEEGLGEEDLPPEEEIDLPSLPPSEVPGNRLVFTAGSPQFTINGQTRTSLGTPFIDPATDRMMVPLRTLSETTGARVEWDSENRAALVFLATGTLTIPADEMLPDGMGSVIIVDDRVFIPLRFVMDAFDATVEWDSVNRAAVITW